MFMWLRKILGLCSHKWVILNKKIIFECETDKLPVGENYIMQCSQCGMVKSVKTYN